TNSTRPSVNLGIYLHARGCLNVLLSRRGKLRANCLSTCNSKNKPYHSGGSLRLGYWL
ncbi:hypothetical protein MTO96_039779, partial [Rhipicephalus appendiculatus]